MYDLFGGARGSRVRTGMVFVDGENLAIRGGDLLNQGYALLAEASYRPSVYLWTQRLSQTASQSVLRQHYYTAAQADLPLVVTITDELKAIGIEAPRVFAKVKGGRSKRVDVSLTTEMLVHACRKNYEVAYLVTGDEDYIPLVQAVKAEGCRVILWFIDSGLSPALKREVDHFADIGNYFFQLPE